MNEMMVQWVGRAKKALAPRDRGPSTICAQCQMSSYKPKHVELGYCSNCQQFYNLMDINDAKGVVTVWNR